MSQKFTDLLDDYLSTKQFYDAMRAEWSGPPEAFLDAHWASCEMLEKARDRLNDFFANYLDRIGLIDLGA